MKFRGSRARWTSLFLVVLLLVGGCRSASDPSNDQLLIVDVTVIDAVDGVRSGQNVLIENDRIVSVSPSTEAAIESGVHIVDGHGKFLIPGLWDAHVHLTFDPLVGPDTFFRLSIANGVTSLRDTGGHLDQLEDARVRARSGFQGLTN